MTFAAPKSKKTEAVKFDVERLARVIMAGEASNKIAAKAAADREEQRRVEAYFNENSEHRRKRQTERTGAYRDGRSICFPAIEPRHLKAAIEAREASKAGGGK